MKEKRRIPSVLRTQDEERESDEATITISLVEYERLRKGQKLTPGQLTREELGSFLPSFQYLADKPDSFKNGTELMAHQLQMNEHWKHLVTQLKQEQVNKLLFSDKPEDVKSLEFIRGSINGIYMFEEIIEMLAASRAGRLSPPEG